MDAVVLAESFDCSLVKHCSVGKSESEFGDVPFHSQQTVACGFVFDPGGDALRSSSSEFDSECMSTIDNVWSAGWGLPLITDADESIFVLKYGESSPVRDESKSIAASASAFEHEESSRVGDESRVVFEVDEPSPACVEDTERFCGRSLY